MTLATEPEMTKAEPPLEGTGPGLFGIRGATSHDW